jgi:hypothetical protein
MTDDIEQRIEFLEKTAVEVNANLYVAAVIAGDDDDDPEVDRLIGAMNEVAKELIVLYRTPEDQPLDTTEHCKLEQPACGTQSAACRSATAEPSGGQGPTND